jgi:hypothetical protein
MGGGLWCLGPCVTISGIADVDLHSVVLRQAILPTQSLPSERLWFVGWRCSRFALKKPVSTTTHQCITHHIHVDHISSHLDGATSVFNSGPICS